MRRITCMPPILQFLACDGSLAVTPPASSQPVVPVDEEWLAVVELDSPWLQEGISVSARNELSQVQRDLPDDECHGMQRCSQRTDGTGPTGKHNRSDHRLL